MKLSKFILLLLSVNILAVETRLKDIARIEGIRDNQIVGYGVVVGLQGTGDTKSAMTEESIKNYLKQFEIDAKIKTGNTRNIASVLISANIPSYARKGDKIDITVSSIGDARSLEGGVLLQSPLKSGDGQTMAVGSGVISFSGGQIQEGYSGKKRNKNVGIIHNGAIVENDIQADFFNKDFYRIVFNEQDFATLNTAMKMIESTFQTSANPVSPIQLEVKIPEGMPKLEFLSALENMVLNAESRARVVINERSGTIVMGGNITVNEVAISKNGLSITVLKNDDEEKKQNVFMISEGTSVSDIVDALNKVGATTKDIIAIIEGLKKSGALHAEVYIQ